MAAQQISPATISRLGTSVYPSMAMLAGMQLDIFTPLKDGPLPYSSVAKAIGVNPEKLRPLLYSLVDAGLLTVEAERFANTPEADLYLVRGRPTYMGSSHELFMDLWSAAFVVGRSIRDDAPHSKHDWSGMTGAELVTFFRGLHAGALASGRQLAEIEKLERLRSLLDVGGGSGGLAIAACQACPTLRATVAELPKIAPIASGFVKESGLVDRVQVIEADVTHSRPNGSYDIAVFRNLLQVLPREQARRALSNVGAAIETRS